MGYLSIDWEYVFLPLVYKEAAMAYGKAEYSQVGNPSKITGRRKVESENMLSAAVEARCNRIQVTP